MSTNARFAIKERDDLKHRLKRSEQDVAAYRKALSVVAALGGNAADGSFLKICGAVADKALKGEPFDEMVRGLL